MNEAPRYKQMFASWRWQYKRVDSVVLLHRGVGI